MEIVTNLCNQCNNEQCVFQSNIYRNDCEFFISKKKNEDCISRQEAIRIAEQGQIQGYIWQFKKLCNLPPVEPERKTGKWICECDAEGEGDNLYRCEKCNVRVAGRPPYDIPNYCPKCGAKMEVEK